MFCFTSIDDLHEKVFPNVGWLVVEEHANERGLSIVVFLFLEIWEGKLAKVNSTSCTLHGKQLVKKCWGFWGMF